MVGQVKVEGSGELSCSPPFLFRRQSRSHPRQLLRCHRLGIGVRQGSRVDFFIGHCFDLRPIRLAGRKVIAAVAYEFGSSVFAHLVQPYGH